MTRIDCARAVMALASMVALACEGTDAMTPAELAGREERVVTPIEDEQVCDAPAPHVAPARLLEMEGVSCDAHQRYCFRLAPTLREVAALHDPIAALTRSARAYDAFLRSGDIAEEELARALADLAVSGETSYAVFAALAPTAIDLRVASGDGLGPNDATAPSARAAELALERAYAVAWALHGPPAHRAEARPALGWIAVSPEDDLPSRPVNIASSPFPQSDLVVSVPLDDGTPRALRTRLVIASTRATDAPAPAVLTGVVPPIVEPSLPDEGDVLLYLPGHSSLAEEGATLASALVDVYAAEGRDVTVILVDLPSNGYAERLDPSEVIDAAGGRDDAVLRFLDAFTIAVVDALEARQPGLAARLSVIGGSLGGNLGLRVAEQSAGRAWPRVVVSWSPASIDQSWARAALPLAARPGQYVDLIKHEAVRLTRDLSVTEEEFDSREDWFTAGNTSVLTQSGYWYRDDFEPCGSRFVEEGLANLGETYDARLRRWHYRVAYEQLVFSHVDYDFAAGGRPYERLSVPLLLITGAEDDAVPMQTWTFVEHLAPKLGVPGTTLYLEDTGHAMHAERPALLAREIASFLLEP